MIDVSRIIHSRNFVQDLTIERTHNGEFADGVYESTLETLTVRGVLVNPKNSKEIELTPEGARATGFVNIYVDKTVQLYTTRERSSGNNISDVIVENVGTAYEVRYKITNVFSRSKWGFNEAEAVRMDAR
jgi:hypothetical protein